MLCQVYLLCIFQRTCFSSSHLGTMQKENMIEIELYPLAQREEANLSKTKIKLQKNKLKLRKDKQSLYTIKQAYENNK